MPRTFFRDQYVPPTDKRFRMRVGNHHLIVTTNVIGVEVEYFSSLGQSDGDWKVWLDYAENPDFVGLRHPRLGWDLVGLSRLLWAYIGMAETIQLNDRPNGKVSVPFHLEEGVRQWRESNETRSLIHSVLSRSEHPMSRLAIARAIGLKKHPRLNQLLEAMVEAGEIKRSEEALKNGKSRYLYSDNKDTPA